MRFSVAILDAVPRGVRPWGMVGLTLAAGWLGIGVLEGCRARQPAAPLPPLAEPLSTSPTDTGQYRLERGDVLRVKFTYQPELDIKVQIDPDGNISIPNVGEFRAAGRTAAQLARDVEIVSSDHLRDPEVTVIVAQLAPRLVYVSGEVRLPGPVPYRVGMTPLQAIVDRGGFTEAARIDSVLHLTQRDDQVEATRLDFSEELQRGIPHAQALAVNDVIFVPRTFIGDADAFVRMYIINMLPVMPRLGIGLTP